MNESGGTVFDFTSATYASAATYFAIVGTLAVFINVSIMIVYFKNKKVLRNQSFRPVVDVIKLF